MRAGGGGGGAEQRSAEHAGCGGRRAHGRRDRWDAPLGSRSLVLQGAEPGPPALRAAAYPRDTSATERHGAGGPGGERRRALRERLGGRSWLPVPSRPAVLHSCVSGTEPTRRTRGAGAAAATATAAVESCDNQAARALAAALAGAQPLLPRRPERGSHQDQDLLGKGELGSRAGSVPGGGAGGAVS